jgi:pimeloyl-ACP methyl ester carboxylesterase
LPRPIGIAPTPPPRLEGIINLAGGRRLGYAEYGEPSGTLVLWCHGMPGARRQVPLGARDAAARLGLRIVCVERPGVGDSTDHLYGRIAEWASDAGEVVDRLGHDRFLTVGLSAGGPYALACAHELGDRVMAVGLLGSLVPTAGEDAVADGLVALSERFNGILRLSRRPLGIALWAFVRAANPFSHLIVQAFGRVMPEGDRRVLSDSELEAVFVDDLTRGSERQFLAFVNDLILVGRPWGFRLHDITVPVRWWHGDSDPFVSLQQAQAAAAMLPDVEFTVRPGESHLGDFAAGEQVIEALARLLPELLSPPKGARRGVDV